MLKTHVCHKNHECTKIRVYLTERKDIKRDKLEAAQDKMPNVKWGDEDVQNSWQFPCLGSFFHPNVDQLPDA